MRIDELITLLQKAKEQHGYIKCVVETTDLWDNLIHSMVEQIAIVEFSGPKAVKVEWRR